MSLPPTMSKLRRRASAPTRQRWRRDHVLLLLGRYPFREARLRAYIVAEHRRGRPVAEILDDPYVRRCGSEAFCWRVLEDPRTLAALGQDVRDLLDGNAA